MQLIAHLNDQATRRRREAERGFTLIEVMIVVAIIGILAAIALPSYRDYILRGQLVDATNLLSAGRANMERYFQDNRQYSNVSATIYAPCDTAAPGRVLGKFTLTCSAVAATTYTLQAQGSGSVSNFSYTVDQTGAKSTTITSGGPWPAVAGSATSCWILKRGESCPP